MLTFCHHELELPERTIPVSCVARGQSIVGVLLDLTAESALEQFLERGLSPTHDRSDPFLGFFEELTQYATGTPFEWRTPIRFEEGTAFQRRIWKAIDEIPFGESATYAALAAAVGAPGGARAAGGACGRNPIPLRVPCHRVVRAGGELGGFTGVIETKRALLRHEGVAPFSDGPLFKTEPVERSTGGQGTTISGGDLR